MTFIDLMDSVVWTETDIVNRTESMIRKEFSVAEENILTRKTSATIMGQYSLSADELAEIQRYAVVCEAAQIAGKNARADMVTLQSALDLEKAQSILSNIKAYSGNLVTWAQGIVDNAHPEVLSLVGERARNKKP